MQMDPMFDAVEDMIINAQPMWTAESLGDMAEVDEWMSLLK